jgi:HlyD family secretion protein
VSYLTILEVKNDELLLRPGMTATAEITTARRKEVHCWCPTPRLRYSPPVAQAARPVAACFPA